MFFYNFKHFYLKIYGKWDKGELYWSMKKKSKWYSTFADSKHYPILSEKCAQNVQIVLCEIKTRNIIQTDK